MNETTNSNTSATACACAVPSQSATPVLQPQSQPIAPKTAPEAPKGKRSNNRKK